MHGSVSSNVDLTASYNLSIRSIQSVGPLKAVCTCSFRHQFDFSGNHSSHAAGYTEASWRERKCPNFDTVQMEDSSPGCHDCESSILPPSFSGPREYLSDSCNIFRCTALFSESAKIVLVTIVTYITF